MPLLCVGDAEVVERLVSHLREEWRRKMQDALRRGRGVLASPGEAVPLNALVAAIRLAQEYREAADELEAWWLPETS